MLPGGDLGCDGFAAGEPAVGYVQVTGPVGGLEVRGQRGFPDVVRPGRPRGAAAAPHVGDLHHPDLRGGVRAGAGRAAEVRGVAGGPAGALAVAALGIGDLAGRAVLSQHPQAVPAAAGPRPARHLQGPQPDRRADLPAQPGQQPRERPDQQEAAGVRQRRRGRQIISRIGLPGPLRQRPQRRRGRSRAQRPRQVNLHRQPRRDLPRPPGRHRRQHLIQQRRGDHRRCQPQPGPLPHRPRGRRHPSRLQIAGRPRGRRGRRAGQRPARHDPRTRARQLQQPAIRVPPDRRHRHHLGQPRRRVPHRPLAPFPPRNPRPAASRPVRRHGRTPGSGYCRSRKHRRTPRKRQVQEPPMLPHFTAFVP